MCLTVGVFGLAPAGASAATPASLAGEFFTNEVPGTLSGSCTSDNNGSFTFSVSGTALGPYPGTFTESGSFTITGGFVTAFSASFTVTSTAGSVKGSKSVDVGGEAACDPADNSVRLDPTVNYTATIKGAYRDTGAGSVLIGVSGGTLDSFTENFDTSNGVVPLQNANGQGQNGNGQGQNG